MPGRCILPGESPHTYIYIYDAHKLITSGDCGDMLQSSASVYRRSPESSEREWDDQFGRRDGADACDVSLAATSFAEGRAEL